MALFKPLYGDESRLSFDITPFHLGYMYLTTNGRLYFDTNVGTQENPDYQRVRINADALSYMEQTLTEEQKAQVRANIGVQTNNELSNSVVAEANQYTDAEIEKLAEVYDSKGSASSALSDATKHADDLNTAMDTRMQAVEGTSHTHSNQDELDLFVSGDKTKLDESYAEKHSHSNAGILGAIDSDDITKWNSAEQNAKNFASTEIGKLSSIYDAKGSAATAKSEANTYTDQKVAELLNNSSEAVDSIFELRDAMEDNADAISALESIAAGHAPKDHTHNYAGSASAGGSANSAVKLDSSAGSITQPVYFSGGKPVATIYSLNKTVPADAKFTDTVYTHPSYTARTGVPTTDQNPVFGGSFSVSQPVIDATGHVTYLNNRTIVIPSVTSEVVKTALGYTPLKTDDTITRANKTQSIYSGVTSSSDTAGTWTVSIDGITELYDGLTIKVKLSTSYNSTYNTLNLNGLGAKVVWFRYSSRLTSHLAANAEVFLTYRSTATSSAYTPSSGALSGKTCTDGWVLPYNYYNADTKNTTGAGNTSSKIYLVGAKTQSTSPTTYTHDTAYVDTDGCVYSGGIKTSVEGHEHPPVSPRCNVNVSWNVDETVYTETWTQDGKNYSKVMTEVSDSVFTTQLKIDGVSAGLWTTTFDETNRTANTVYTAQ